MNGKFSSVNLGTQPHLDLVAWISVHPIPEDVPVERLRVTCVTPGVLDGFWADVHVAFRDGFHIVRSNSAS